MRYGIALSTNRAVGQRLTRRWIPYLGPARASGRKFAPCHEPCAGRRLPPRAVGRAGHNCPLLAISSYSTANRLLPVVADCKHPL